MHLVSSEAQKFAGPFIDQCRFKDGTGSAFQNGNRRKTLLGMVIGKKYPFLVDLILEFQQLEVPFYFVKVAILSHLLRKHV